MQMANRTLRFGSNGNDVLELQRGLNLLLNTQPKLAEDGVYGPKTFARVREFQGSRSLAPDGVVGAKTWEVFLKLLGQMPPGIQVPTPTDLQRGLVLTIAQSYLGSVDFSVLINGRPKGIDFLIQMFQFAANTAVTDAAFKGSKGEWVQEPLIGGKRKSWCGVFAVYCYRLAGINVMWDMSRPGPVGITTNNWSPTFAQDIKPGDIGVVASKQHHFLIESVGSGPVPRMTTLDGNQTWGRINRIWSNTAEAHQVGKDNFNYYSLP